MRLYILLFFAVKSDKPRAALNIATDILSKLQQGSQGTPFLGEAAML